MIKKTVLALGLVGLLSACDNSTAADAISHAERKGWTHVSVTDSSYFSFSCARGYKGYDISGVKPGGRHEETVVCCPSGLDLFGGCYMSWWY